MPLGTSIDYESADSRTIGCWDLIPALKPLIENWTTVAEVPDFILDDIWCETVSVTGFGLAVD